MNIFYRTFILLIFYCTISSQAFSQKANVQDSLELVKLYHKTNGDNWINNRDWLTDRLENWYGVSLERDRSKSSYGRVINLYLPSNQLSGSIPGLNLPALEHLILSFNQLSGSIPNFNLPALKSLDLLSNQLSGSIPNFNLPALQNLNLSYNHLSGSIPNFDLPVLHTLDLQKNQLTFEWLEPVAQRYQSASYSPQAPINIHQHEDNVLAVSAGGTLRNNTYRWYRDGSLAAIIAGDSTYAITTKGDYTVQVTNSIATRLLLVSNPFKVSTITGIKKGIEANFVVFPVPAKEVLNILLPDDTKWAEVRIFGGDGKVCLEASSKHQQNQLFLKVDKLSNGIYFVVISTDKGQFSKTIIIN